MLAAGHRRSPARAAAAEPRRGERRRTATVSLANIPVQTNVCIVRCILIFTAILGNLYLPLRGVWLRGPAYYSKVREIRV